MLAVVLTVLAFSPDPIPYNAAVMGRGSSAAAPAPFFTAFSSNPATECAGSNVASDDGSATAITHTNATVTRYCTKSDGTLVAMTANQPRLTNAGLLVEGGRTNIQVRSSEFNQWTCTNVTTPTANTHADPVGTTTAEILTTTSSGGFCNGPSDFTPSQTTGAFSLYVRTASGTQNFSIVARDNFASADRTTTCSITQATTTWQLTKCHVTGMTSANVHHIRVYPGTAAGSGSLVVWGAQFEVPSVGAAFVTSPIPSTNTSLARSNDAFSWTNPTDISTQGCLAATVTFNTATGGTFLSNGTEKMMGSGSATTITANDGTNTVTATVSDVTNRTIDIKVKWSGSTMTVVADGVTASGTFDGAFSSTATMHVGRQTTASGYANAHIKQIKVGSDPEACN
jgi:hypothetical protein